MHEMSTVIRLVNMASSVAVENNATSVKKIKVAIGEMTGVLPEYVRKYYPEAVILDSSGDDWDPEQPG